MQCKVTGGGGWQGGCILWEGLGSLERVQCKVRGWGVGRGGVDCGRV